MSRPFRTQPLPLLLPFLVILTLSKHQIMPISTPPQPIIKMLQRTIHPSSLNSFSQVFLVAFVSPKRSWLAPICPSIPLSLPVCVYVCVLHVCVCVSLPKCWSLPCWPSSHQKRGQLVPTCLSPLDPTLLPTSYMQLKLKHNCKAVFRSTHAFHAVGLHLTKDGACWYLRVCLSLAANFPPN